jgi:hypothetical protein
LLASGLDGIFLAVQKLARLAVMVGLAVGVGAAGAGCRTRDATITGPFSDDFNRAELGAGWNATGPEYRVSDGQLRVANAYNHPAWLRRKLPHDVVIDVDAVSRSPAGDIKIELFGDGESFDPDKGGYVSTGYMLIFGGWHNSLSVICRNDEHNDGRKSQRTDIRVQPGRTYHWTVTRRGGTIDWQMDGRPFLSWADPEPLGGAGHEYMAVNDWESDVSFDNLEIRPAPGP